MLGQQNDPSDIGFIKSMLYVSYGAIAVLFTSLMRVFWVVFSRNERLRKEVKRLKKKCGEECSEDDDE